MPAFVATLVAAPASRLTDAALARVAQALPQGASRRWLAPGEAADLEFDGAADLPALRAAAAEIGADAIVQDAATRDKKLLVADMDSTLIGQECIDELAKVAGIGERVAAITERAMRGELDFPARCASASGCSKASTPASSTACSPNGSPSTPAPRPWRRRFARAAAISPSSPAASSRSPARWRRGSAPTNTAPTG